VTTADDRALLPWRKALDAVLAECRPLEAERIPLREARGRVLAEAVSAPDDLPPFRNSAMDGFAVCTSDLAMTQGSVRTGIERSP